jgi:hypothetical protein
MPAHSETTRGAENGFKVHSRRGTERFVDICDTFEEAVGRACRKLAKHPDLIVWITDAANRIVLEEGDLRKRCES